MFRKADPGHALINRWKRWLRRLPRLSDLPGWLGFRRQPMFPGMPGATQPGYRTTSLFRPQALFALILGGLLVWVGGPYVVSAAHRAPHHDVLRDVGLGRSPPLGRIVSAIRSYEEALRWYNDGRHRAELGFLYCAGADLLGVSERRAFLASCVDAHREALMMEPAQPYAALQLAAALSRTRGISAPGVLDAFRLSIETGPRAPRLVIRRVELALLIWPFLDAELNRASREQIRLAAEWRPGELAALGSTPGRDRLIESVLRVSPELLDRYRTFRARITG